MCGGCGPPNARRVPSSVRRSAWVNRGSSHSRTSRPGEVMPSRHNCRLYRGCSSKLYDTAARTHTHAQEHEPTQTNTHAQEHVLSQYTASADTLLLRPPHPLDQSQIMWGRVTVGAMGVGVNPSALHAPRCRPFLVKPVGEIWQARVGTGAGSNRGRNYSTGPDVRPQKSVVVI